MDIRSSLDGLKSLLGVGTTATTAAAPAKTSTQPKAARRAEAR